MTRREIFERAMYFVRISEGGTNDDPNDRGGFTKYGICEKQYPNLNISELTLASASQIYYNDYWLRNSCQSMQDNLAIVLFDTSVNCGQPSAAQWLQKTINELGGDLVLDGVIGPVVLAEVYAQNSMKLMAGIIAYRLRRYTTLLKMDNTQYKFVRGWIKRVADLIIYAI